MIEIDSSTIELSDAQERIISELVSMHNSRADGPVKGKEIAASLDQNPGTIRSQMQSLKSLGLVNGIPGPKGGYEPTTRAYELLDVERSTEYSPVPIDRNGTAVEGTTVTEIDLINLHHPDRHEAEVYVQGQSHQFERGDTITVGPISGSDLVLTGTVDAVENSESVCLVQIDDLFFDPTPESSPIGVADGHRADD